MVGCSPAGVAVKPTPVRVDPACVRAVIACMPGPARPPPSGAAGVQVVPGAAPAGSVQSITSSLPGPPYVPVAVNPPAAVASAVTARPPVFAALAALAAAALGAGRVVSVQVKPPSADTAANGSCCPAAVTSVPAAATRFALAATYASAALAAEPGSGSVTSDQVRPVADSQAAGRVPAEPTAVNPAAVAVTAFICLSPAPSSAPGRASAARCQPVRPVACHAAATVRPPTCWRPTMTYPFGPAATAAVTRGPAPVKAAEPSSATHVRPSAEPTTTGCRGGAGVPPPTASQPAAPWATAVNCSAPGLVSTAGVDPAARAHVEPPSAETHSAGSPSAPPAATWVAPDAAIALTASCGIVAPGSARSPILSGPPVAPISVSTGSCSAASPAVAPTTMACPAAVSATPEICSVAVLPTGSVPVHVTPSGDRKAKSSPRAWAVTTAPLGPPLTGPRASGAPSAVLSVADLRQAAPSADT